MMPIIPAPAHGLMADMALLVAVPRAGPATVGLHRRLRGMRTAAAVASNEENLLAITVTLRHNTVVSSISSKAIRLLITCSPAPRSLIMIALARRL